MAPMDITAIRETAIRSHFHLKGYRLRVSTDNLFPTLSANAATLASIAPSASSSCSMALRISRLSSVSSWSTWNRSKRVSISSGVQWPERYFLNKAWRSPCGSIAFIKWSFYAITDGRKKITATKLIFLFFHQHADEKDHQIH